jgi:glutamate-1-semialdehyde 2,1-aminomutase
MSQWQRSHELYTRAQSVIAGGVNSNVRLQGKSHPLFFKRAEGAMLYDVDGNAYIDYILAQGPMLLGHSHPAVLAAVAEAMQEGQLYAGQHELEITVAEQLVDLIPCAELCRFGLSGSDMVQVAMRLARAVTGRSKILRFEGHYHGWLDNVLISSAPPLAQAGPRERPHATGASAGQVASALEDVVVLPWNDLELVEKRLAEQGHEIAAIMLEPMMCNTGAILPKAGYLEGLRRLCDEYGALLYFDETITGFRVHLRGAQTLFGVTPDIASFAKAVGGGFVNSVLVGKRAYMQRIGQDVNHSGSFNSNVISMAASAVALAELAHDEGALYMQMDRIGTALMNGIAEIATRRGCPLHVQGVPTAFHLAFTELPALQEYRDYAQHCDSVKYDEFALAMLKRGVRLLNRGIWYISTAHTMSHVEQSLAAVEGALAEIGM